MAFGDLLEKVGSMGLFQIVYVCFLSIPVLMIASHNLIQNFSAAVPEHHCQTSIQMNGTQSNLTQHLHPEDLLKVSIPLDGKQKPEQCLQFTTTQWQLLEGNATLLEVETEPCRDGWVFDDSVFASSIVTEWELVCDLRSLKELAQSLFMAGVLIGALIFGSLSDRWLPESARWLIVNNKTEVALRNLKRVAKMNGKKEEGEKISLEMLQLEVAEKSPKASTHSILDLFRTPAMCRISCCLMFVSFSTNFAYFGLSMDLRNFGFSTHLVQMLFGSIDVFAKILCGVMLTFFGRRTVQASSLILAGIFLLANTALPLDMQTFRITLVMLGKGCLSASSLCSYLYSGELFPTVVRQTGMGLTTMMARLGGIVAPMVLMAGDYVAFLPLVIFGGAPIISGVAACFLPEMLNAPLLDTIEEVEDRARRKEIVTIQEKRAEIVIEVIEGTRL
ncbi:solute carrier family 22 member 6-B-like isoform X2 [Rhinatrema bivittatum]|uniref:solute carrier family 22 member 6-B-like isoform X2 n=1 Tax=Rhinatrema bivittatum TaxID=194408 RepID=UPI00112A0A6A|nr:solute carrier family 22 member 6-B-like isoform X2 [Rhinatrema bivittatum]